MNHNSDKMSCCKKVSIVNDLGLHARSAAQIAGIAQNAGSDVWITKEDEKVDAKSIIDMLSLACGKGASITIRIDSESDRHVLAEIAELVEAGFGELNNG